MMVKQVLLVAWFFLHRAVGLVPSSQTPPTGAERYSGREDDSRRLSRRESLAVGAWTLLGAAQAAGAKEAKFGRLPSEGFVEKSGLRYYDYAVGQGNFPRYGQVLRVEFVASAQVGAGAETVKFFSTFDRGMDTFIFKHGNGRMIRVRHHPSRATLAK